MAPLLLASKTMRLLVEKFGCPHDSRKDLWAKWSGALAIKKQHSASYYSDLCRLPRVNGPQKKMEIQRKRMLLMIELNIMFNSLEQDDEGKVLSREWGEKLAEKRNEQLERYPGILDSMGACVKPGAWLRGTKLSWEEFVDAVHRSVPRPPLQEDGKKSFLETYQNAVAVLSWKIENLKQHNLIDKDTRRSLTDHPIFGRTPLGKAYDDESAENVTDDETGEVANGVPAISRILHAYMHHSTGFGYTQGMGSMVAYFLLVLGDEELAFWLMCALMQKASKLFDTDMKLNIDIMIEDMQAERISKFMPAVPKDEVPKILYYYACRWYPSLFNMIFHGSTWVRVWDIFLYTIYENTHGSSNAKAKDSDGDELEKALRKVFSRIGVALIKSHPRFMMTSEDMMSNSTRCDFDKFLTAFCP